MQNEIRNAKGNIPKSHNTFLLKIQLKAPIQLLKNNNLYKLLFLINIF